MGSLKCEPEVGSPSVPHLKNVVRRFLPSLDVWQGPQDDTMEYIRQHTALKPPMKRQEANGIIEAIGFIPIALDNIVPHLPNTMLIDNVHAPPRAECPSSGMGLPWCCSAMQHIVHTFLLVTRPPSRNSEAPWFCFPLVRSDFCRACFCLR